MSNYSSNSNPASNVNTTTPLMTDDKIGKVKSQISEVTSIMHANIEQVIERGEKISDLENKTAQLEADAKSFRGKAKNLKQHMCMKNTKLTACIIFIIVAIIGVILLAVYAGGKSTK